MTDELKDPPRLLVSSDDELLKDMLDAGSREFPADDAMNRLSIAIGAIGIAGGGAAGGGAGGAAATTSIAPAKIAATKAGTSTLVKVIGGVVLGSALTAGGVATYQAIRHDATDANVVLAPPTSASLIASVSPSSTAAPVASNDDLADAGAIADTNADAGAPASIATTRPATKPSTTASSDVTDSEVTLLQRAQDALRSDPATALALANSHRAKYPNGMLAQEREVIAVEALEKLHRTAEADRRAAAFARAYPQSSHIPRLTTLVGHPL